MIDDKIELYNFYDKILNCLVINTKTITRRNKRKGYYISNFNFKNKENLLLIEIIKIINMFESKNNALPILIQYNNFKGFIQFFKLKFKLRENNIKVKKARITDINYDLDNNLSFVCRELNFPRTVYEEIYDAYYEKGGKIDA